MFARRNTGLAVVAWSILAVAIDGYAARSRERRVEVRATPDEVTLGGGGPQVVDLAVRVFDPRPERIPDADVILHTTAGRIADLREVGPGKYHARLHRPKETFPQLALVSAADLSAVALGQPPWVGTAVVAFSARIKLKGQTEPSAEMEVRIQGRRYGPVMADHSGDFAIPVLVRPGEGWARGISRDQVGNASRSRINLFLPEVERVHVFVFPPELVADGKDSGWIFVNTVGYSGAPEDAAISARATRGWVGPAKRLGTGTFRVTYRAPRGTGDDSDQVAIIHRKRRTVRKVGIRLLSGAPEQTVAQILPLPVPADGQSAARVEVTVKDAAGSPVRDQTVHIRVGEESLPVSEHEHGYRAEIPPRATVGQLPVHIEVVPSTTGCHRGRLLRGMAGWHVVDVRGIGCAGRFRVVEPGHTVIESGELGPDGLLSHAPTLLKSFAAGARLEMDGAQPRRIVVYAGSRPSGGIEVARPQILTRTVSWHVPVGVGITIHELRRQGQMVHLRVRTRGVDTPIDRIRVESHPAAHRVIQSGTDHVDVVVSLDRRPTDVVATDTNTGVTAWLRVE